jgi:LmbE family N-acetylglucosaminyl deacetylase
VGALALRLLRQGGMRVVDVAVTQGSNKARQAPRLAELKGACNYLGFDVIQVQEGGLEKINPKGQAAAPENWAEAVRKIAAILAQQQPRVVFIPHERDANTTHIGTHLLVLDAIRTLGPAFSCYVVETEFWAPMDGPNLMVEVSATDLADLIAALSFHVEEVRRNPYHLTLPSWMRDNVRRGGEIVGGQGAAAPNYAFATLYRLRRWQNGQLVTPFEGGKFLGAGDDVKALFA